MTLQLLISTINQTDYSLLDKMNIQSDAVVVNQCDKDELSVLKCGEHTIKWILMSARGIGLSGNTRLFHASADIVLWADDDLVYHDGYPIEVMKAFENNQKADLIFFNVSVINSTKNIGVYPRNTKKKKTAFL